MKITEIDINEHIHQNHWLYKKDIKDFDFDHTIMFLQLLQTINGEDKKKRRKKK